MMTIGIKLDKMKISRLIWYAILLILSGCHLSDATKVAKMKKYFKTNEIVFDELKKSCIALNENCGIENFELYENRARIIDANRNEHQFSEIEKKFTDSCRTLFSKNISVMSGLDIQMIYTRDSSVTFYLKSNFLFLDSEIYILYSVEKNPYFQEIDLKNKLISDQADDRWAKKLKENWFLIVLARNL